MAEWLMAADCKSAALCATEVRILPCAPLLCRACCLKLHELISVVDWNCCGYEPGRQRTDGNCAGCTGIVGDSRLADDGARQVSIADMDTVRIFCLPCHTWTVAFEVGL